MIIIRLTGVFTQVRVSGLGNDQSVHKPEGQKQEHPELDHAVGPDMYGAECQRGENEQRDDAAEDDFIDA